VGEGGCTFELVWDGDQQGMHGVLELERGVMETLGVGASSYWKKTRVR